MQSSDRTHCLVVPPHVMATAAATGKQACDFNSTFVGFRCKDWLEYEQKIEHLQSKRAAAMLRKVQGLAPSRRLRLASHRGHVSPGIQRALGVQNPRCAATAVVPQGAGGDEWCRAGALAEERPVRTDADAARQAGRELQADAASDLLPAFQLFL